MNTILLVDDDKLIVEIYRKKLVQHGYEVVVAQDGLAAIRALHETRPRVVVLDIMMPKFNGLEVLEFIRAKPDLANTRVVVLSNYYTDDDKRERATAKADRHLTKSNCTPARLILAVSSLMADDSAPTQAPSVAPVTRPAPVAPAPAAVAIVKEVPSQRVAGEAPSEVTVRREFLKDAPKTLATLQQLNAAFIRAEVPQARNLRLLDLYRKVHYVTAIAGMADCGEIAMLCSAFEALLLELYERPQNLSPSILKTIAYTLDFLARLFANAETAGASVKSTGKTLVVDDDAISVRAMSIALQRANLQVASFRDPLAALQAATAEPFDLVLLDVLMPGLDGLELCKKLRALPQYQSTPIIFVTGVADFQTRAKSVLNGGNDLIAKPVLPLELALKAVTHLLRNRLPQPLALN